MQTFSDCNLTQPQQLFDHHASKEGSLCVCLVCPGAYELSFEQVSNKKRKKKKKKKKKNLASLRPTDEQKVYTLTGCFQLEDRYPLLSPQEPDRSWFVL